MSDQHLLVDRHSQAPLKQAQRPAEHERPPRPWHPPAKPGPPGAPDAANPKADARPNRAAERYPLPEHRAESSRPQSALSPRPASADIHASAAQPRCSHQTRSRHPPSSSPSESSERNSPLRQRTRTVEINGTGTAHTVLKISGLPWRARASSTASMQKSASSVIDTRQARTRRVNQSSTAAR